MAKCKHCGKSGLFLRLDKEGRCSACAAKAEKAASSFKSALSAPAPKAEKPTSSDSKGFLSTLYPNAAGLYPQEILVLEYSKFKHYCVNEDNDHVYWWNAYSIKDINKLLDQFCDRGFLRVGDLPDTLQLYKVPELKAVLSEHSLKATGKKDDLIARLVEGVPAETLRKSFPRRPYIITDAGEAAIRDDGYVLSFSRAPVQGLDLYALNRLMKGDPRRYRDVIWGHFNKASMDYVKDNQYGLYANCRMSMARFLCEENKYEQAAPFVIEACCYELCVRPNDFNYLSSFTPPWFPYEGSILHAGYASMLKEYQAKLDMNDSDFQQYIADNVNRISAPFNIFTPAESAEIIFCEMRGDHDRLHDIYETVRKRLRKKYPKAKF